jgi:hypothetical protein
MGKKRSRKSRASLPLNAKAADKEFLIRKGLICFYILVSSHFHTVFLFNSHLPSALNISSSFPPLSLTPFLLVSA